MPNIAVKCTRPDDVVITVIFTEECDTELLKQYPPTYTAFLKTIAIQIASTIQIGTDQPIYITHIDSSLAIKYTHLSVETILQIKKETFCTLDILPYRLKAEEVKAEQGVVIDKAIRLSPAVAPKVKQEQVETASTLKSLPLALLTQNRKSINAVYDEKAIEAHRKARETFSTLEQEIQRLITSLPMLSEEKHDIGYRDSLNVLISKIKDAQRQYDNERKTSFEKIKEKYYDFTEIIRSNYYAYTANPATRTLHDFKKKLMTCLLQTTNEIRKKGNAHQSIPLIASLFDLDKDKDSFTWKKNKQADVTIEDLLKLCNIFKLDEKLKTSLNKKLQTQGITLIDEKIQSPSLASLVGLAAKEEKAVSPNKPFTLIQEDRDGNITYKISPWLAGIIESVTGTEDALSDPVIPDLKAEIETLRNLPQKAEHQLTALQQERDKLTAFYETQKKAAREEAARQQAEETAQMQAKAAAAAAAAQALEEKRVAEEEAARRQAEEEAKRVAEEEAKKLKALKERQERLAFKRRLIQDADQVILLLNTHLSSLLSRLSNYPKLQSSGFTTLAGLTGNPTIQAKSDILERLGRRFIRLSETIKPSLQAEQKEEASDEKSIILRLAEGFKGFQEDHTPSRFATLHGQLERAIHTINDDLAKHAAFQKETLLRAQKKATYLAIVDLLVKQFQRVEKHYAEIPDSEVILFPVRSHIYSFQTNCTPDKTPELIHAFLINFKDKFLVPAFREQEKYFLENVFVAAEEKNSVAAEAVPAEAAAAPAAEEEKDPTIAKEKNPSKEKEKGLKKENISSLRDYYRRSIASLYFSLTDLEDPYQIEDNRHLKVHEALFKNIRTLNIQFAHKESPALQATKFIAKKIKEKLFSKESPWKLDWYGNETINIGQATIKTTPEIAQLIKLTQKNEAHFERNPFVFIEALALQIVYRNPLSEMSLFKGSFDKDKEDPRTAIQAKIDQLGNKTPQAIFCGNILKAYQQIAHLMRSKELEKVRASLEGLKKAWETNAFSEHEAAPAPIVAAAAAAQSPAEGGAAAAEKKDEPPASPAP